MARLKIRLFGSFQVLLNEAAITQFESNKVRALLAYLVIGSKKSHNREKLAALFWPEMPAKRASSNLSQAIYNLRYLLQDHETNPPFFLRSRDAIQFNRDSDTWLDVDEFNQNLISDRYPVATRNRYPENLQRAIELYRGDFLEGLSFDSSLVFDEWVLVLRQRFQRQALDGLHQLAAYYAAENNLPKALPLAWRQVELDPLDERACRQLMQFLTINDQRSQALTQFERLQVMLAEELGVTPEPETRVLWEQIRNEDRDTIQIKRKTGNLPVFITPLIGRQKELQEMIDLAAQESCRLLTILGPGGSGKTRLALEVARNCQPLFRDGVYFVPLNPLQSAESILPAIADAVELPRGEGDDFQKQLTHFLKEKSILLVLDGFEHLLAGAALLVEFLHQTTGLKILVTSRVRLNIKGEHLYPLRGMAYPKTEAPNAEILTSDAVQLLIAGLLRSQPNFEPAPEEIKFLHQISQKVQGMPLGILLAASWGAVLNLEEITERVGRSLDFLSADWTDLPDRQRSMRAMFDHTWELLDERVKVLFRSLSVFRGAFTRKAAREVSGASSHELRAMVERSLLLSETPGCYELHELLRQYGLEKLAQYDQTEKEARQGHSNYYLKKLARLGKDFKTSRQIAALRRIDLEHENVRAAWNWAVDQENFPELNLAAEALCLYYSLRMRYPEGIEIIRQTLNRLAHLRLDSTATNLMAFLKIWESNFTRGSGDHAKAKMILDDVQIILEGSDDLKSNPLILAHLYLEFGNFAFSQDLDLAFENYRKSYALLQGLNEPWWLCQVMSRLIINSIQRGAFSEAEKYFIPTQSFFQYEGDPASYAEVLKNRGFYHVRMGQLDQALEWMEEANGIYESLGEPSKIAAGLSSMGTIYGWRGDYQRGLDLLSQSLAIYQNFGANFNITYVQTVIAMLEMHLGHYSVAKKYYLAGLHLARKHSFRRLCAGCLLGLGWLALVNTNYREAQEALRESVIEYQAVNHQEELSWATAALGQTLMQAGDPISGESYLMDAIKIGIKAGTPHAIHHCLAYTAFQQAKHGNLEEALEFYSLANLHPSIAKSQWFEDVAGREIAAAANQLSPELIIAAEKRGRQRDLWKTAAQLLEGLPQMPEHRLQPISLD